jgi:hypothetical protein
MISPTISTAMMSLCWLCAPRLVWAAPPVSHLGFGLPAQNIVCSYLEDERDASLLRCRSKSQLRPIPARPADCSKLNWGRDLLLDAQGRVVVDCANQPSASNYPRLKSKQVWHQAGFQCLANNRGLTCRAKNGRGFLLYQRTWRPL